MAVRRRLNHHAATRDCENPARALRRRRNWPNRQRRRLRRSRHEAALALPTWTTPARMVSEGGKETNYGYVSASHVPSRGFVIVRLIAEALSWLTWALASPKPNGYTRSEDDDVEDEDEEENTENSDIDDEGDWRRKNVSVFAGFPFGC